MTDAETGKMMKNIDNNFSISSYFLSIQYQFGNNIINSVLQIFFSVSFRIETLSIRMQ